MAYAVIELRTLVKFLRGEPHCDQLMQDLLTSAYAAVRRILDVEVVLDSASAKPDAVPRDEPVIVLSRHCGPGDSVLVAWLLAIEYRLQLRIVLKAVLQCEPALDLAGEHAMITLAEQTGGRAYYADQATLDQVFQRIADDLRTQYQLGYYPHKRAPEEEQTGFRSIAVKMSSVANSAKYSVRNRPGYYAHATP